MHHHRRVHAGEHAALEQQDLAAAALLGRRADDADREPDLVGDRAAAEPAPTAAAAIMLWPQAWPMPGSASYSAQIATCSGPLPARATNAVGRSQTPRVDGEARRLRAPQRASRRPLLLEAELGMGVDAVRESISESRADSMVFRAVSFGCMVVLQSYVGRLGRA